MIQSIPHITRAVVISLPGSGRRDTFFNQSAATGFEIFDAFDGSAQDWSSHFDAEEFAERYGQKPTPGQAGCAISHSRVIRQFAAEAGNEHDLLLIAEDDGVYGADFETVLSAVAKRPLPFDLVVLADSWSLEPRRHMRRRLMATRQLSLLSRAIRGSERTYRLGRFAGVTYWAGLYVITRRGARKFDRHIQSLPGEKLRLLADDWAAFRTQMGLDIAILHPSLATWQGGSTTRLPEVLAAEAANEARVQRTNRAKFSEVIAIRSRLRALKLAVRATLDDLRYRRNGSRS